MIQKAKPNILHIDDDEANRYAVKVILERSSFNVISAATGEEGLDLLHYMPDLIILDIRLPDINGFDLCRRIKSDTRYSSIPILQTSATFTSNDNKVEGLESGADGYLAQPIESAVLVATVRSLLRIRKAERLALEATRSREDMLAIVSHDLRNPLAYIMLQVKMLEKTLKNDHYENPKVFEKLASLSGSCTRMNRLIQDLLDVSSIEGGKFKIIPTDFSGNALLKDICNLFEESCKNAGIRFKKISNDEEVMVHGDRERIFQIFSNLIVNAMKFTPEGGEIAISMKALKESIEFLVTDTGPGIPKEDLLHVFDRFWQGHLERKGGFGLGLSIVKGIVDAHGGKIGIEVDGGTKVTFHIPC